MSGRIKACRIKLTRSSRWIQETIDDRYHRAACEEFKWVIILAIAPPMPKTMPNRRITSRTPTSVTFGLLLPRRCHSEPRNHHRASFIKSSSFTCAVVANRWSIHENAWFGLAWQWLPQFFVYQVGTFEDFLFTFLSVAPKDGSPARFTTPSQPAITCCQEPDLGVYGGYFQIALDLGKTFWL